MDKNTNLKYHEHFANAVLDGTKKYEIRKASKGYTSGRKNLISIETKECCKKCYQYEHDMPCLKYDHTPKEIYGSAHYKLIGANNEMLKLRDIDNFAKVHWVIRVSSLDKNIKCNGNQHIKIDKDTYEFAKKNYIDKNIDYVIFEITDPKRNVE